MHDEIYFLEEEKEEAQKVIESTKKLKKNFEEKRKLMGQAGRNVTGLDEKIEMCETRILKKQAKIEYIDSILKFIWRECK